MAYTFNPERAKAHIVEWIREWFDENGPDCKAVIGISGGKDSTITAALCVEALGSQRVHGVLMPKGVPDDIHDGFGVCEALNIQYSYIPLDYTYKVVTDTVKGCFIPSAQTLINIQPRLRMMYLYAIAQTINGRVANTGNLSEISMGYYTLWGDGAGDFAPLASFTKTEVVEIGKLYSDIIPLNLIEKEPSDGLTGKTDEEALGLSYKDIDNWIRYGNSSEIEAENKLHIIKRMDSQFFKSDLTRIPCPYAEDCFEED